MSADWLNDKFFEDFLKESSKDPHLKVLNSNLKIATQKGDNYASIMYRAEITFQEFTKKFIKNVIVKVMPSGEISSKVMIKNKLYPRESLVYTEILKETSDLLSSIDDFTKISPRCLKTDETPTNYLIFEDLRENGYKMGDRKLGLDLKASLMILNKMAKLHACSAILYERNQSIMDMYLNGSITTDPDRQDFLIFYKLLGKSLEACVEKWEGFEEISEKLIGFNERIIQRGVETYTRDDRVFNVLNHNDIWINNFMFKYSEDNELEDVLLLDYQLSYWGSPGIDLNFFLFGSVDSEVREEHFHFMIMNYHRELVRVLQLLKFKGNAPSIRDIHAEIIKTGFNGIINGIILYHLLIYFIYFVGLIATVCLKPLALVEDTSDADMDVLLKETPQGNAFREKLFSNSKFQIILRKCLKYFYYMGYFD